MAKKYLLAEMTRPEFEAGNFDKVILPVGSTENHGFHLPYFTDMKVAYELSKMVAEKVDGLLVMPPISYGMSSHYAYFPMTIGVSAETLIHTLKDILEQVIKNGIKKIFIMNGHDGNIAPIEIAARETKIAHKDVVIATLPAWWVTAGELLPPDTFEVWNGLGHAGEGETSIALALYPELVDMSKAKGIVPPLPDKVEIKWTFDELTDTGATGDPTKATKEKGEKMVKVLVDLLVNFFNDMDKKDWKYGLKLL